MAAAGHVGEVADEREVVGHRGIIPQVIEIETPHGPARAEVEHAAGATAALVLGHGAGGGTGAPDLQAARRAALDAGVSAVLVEQPYRVAGRRSPAPAGQLDTAWLAVIEHLRASELPGHRLVTGGRSSGARVACRTAAASGAAAVLCLAFPVHPPGKPEKSRLDELDGVRVPVLVVQGERDPFGMPPPKRGRRKVVALAGDHGLKADLPAVEKAIFAWLPTVIG
jgi:hypothetical protein